MGASRRRMAVGDGLLLRVGLPKCCQKPHHAVLDLVSACPHLTWPCGLVQLPSGTLLLKGIVSRFRLNLNSFFYLPPAPSCMHPCSSFRLLGRCVGRMRHKISRGAFVLACCVFHCRKSFLRHC